MFQKFMKNLPTTTPSHILGASHLLNAACLSNANCADMPAVSQLATDLITIDNDDKLLIPRLKAVENAMPAFAKLTNGHKVKDILVSIAMDKAAKPISIDGRLAALTTLKALSTEGEIDSSILDMITNAELDAQLRIKAFEAAAAASPSETLSNLVEKHIKENDVDQGMIHLQFDPSRPLIMSSFQSELSCGPSTRAMCWLRSPLGCKTMSWKPSGPRAP